jgi:hypothetical protein
VVIYLINLAISIENNDSEITGLKRNEYISVIRDIMATPVTNSYGFSSLSHPDDSAGRLTANNNGRQDMKHDSFYYLQKTMERRQATARSKIKSRK